MKSYTVKYLLNILFAIAPFIIQSSVKEPLNTTNDKTDSTLVRYQQKIVAAADDSLQLLEVYYKLGEYFDNEGNTEQSILQFSNALQIAENIKNDTQISIITNDLARIYWMNGDFDASNKTYQIGLKSAERSCDSSTIAKISMNLGNNFNYTGEYDKAIKYALHALEIKETANDLERICYHYVSMGNIFKENDNTKKWEEYIRKAYKMKDVEGCASLGDIAKIYNSLGGIAEKHENYEKALVYYDSLMIISKEGNYDQGISTALTNSALVYKQLDNPQKALDLTLEAEKYFGNNLYEQIFNKNWKADLYQLLGQNDKALELVRQNIAEEEINFYSTEKLKCLRLLYELNFQLSNYDEAFRWNDSLRTTENQLRDEDVRKALEELETKYETEKKEQKIDLLTAENHLKNQRINAGIAILAVLLLVIFLISYILRIRKKQATLLQNDLQQQVLRAQMNPHFIFNVLGSIQNFMLQNNSKKASNFLSQFASLIRATLNNSTAETISLADEISMLKNYIDLEKMRKSNQFDYQIIFDEELEIDFIHIPPMLIQPFVENSIKHGFKNLERQGLLELYITDKTNNIEFMIKDNGPGIQKTETEPKEHISMAMTIFEKRKKLIQQKHKKDFTFKMENLQDINPWETGLCTTINIPILD